MKTHILLLLAAALFCGCRNPVPGNRIKGSIMGQPFAIDNPKNTTMRNVTLTAHAGTNSFELRIGEIASTNDPQVIDKAYAGQAAVAKIYFDGAGQLVSQAMQAMAAGATGKAPAPQVVPAPTGPAE
jgi:hypothetical protein